MLPSLRRLDPTSFSEFCSCGCVLQDRSLFTGISLLPGGSAWVISPGGQFRKDFYFRKETWEEQEPLNEAEYHKKFHETIARVIPRYFRDGEKIGMSLTGGLDGRLILSWMKQPAGTLPCYTFGGPYRECYDVQIARRVAKACHQPHQILPVDGDFFANFPELAERTVYLSDGAMDVSGAVELHINQFARQIAPIRMTGNYGSEILRGSIAFKPRPLNTSLYDPEFARLGERAAATYDGEKQGNASSFIAFKQMPWHHYSRLAVEQSQLTLRTPFLDNDIVALTYRAPAKVLNSSVPSLRLITEGNAALGRIPTDRGLLYRPMPVFNSLVRLYREFTFKAEYAYDYGMPQWVTRIDHCLTRLHLERLFLGRHKFYHFRIWYRDQLSEYLKEILMDSRSQSRSYFKEGALKSILQNHIEGRQNNTLLIHQALSCELIHRQFIEKNWEDA